MLIIVEGVDGSGKTTLANELSRRLAIPIYKPLHSPLHGRMTVRESQAEDAGAFGVAVKMQSHMIFDRSFVSESVYGNVYKREVDVRKLQSIWHAVARVPHVAFFLDIEDSLEFWVERKRVNDIHYSYWSALVHEYRAQVDRDTLLNWKVMHADRPPGELAELACMHIQKRIPTIKENA